MTPEDILEETYSLTDWQKQVFRDYDGRVRHSFGLDIPRQASRPLTGLFGYPVVVSAAVPNWSIYLVSGELTGAGEYVVMGAGAAGHLGVGSGQKKLSRWQSIKRWLRRRFRRSR